MKPTKVEYKCGETFHKQQVTLEISQSYQGHTEVKITKHAANQRDDTDRMLGLSIDNILAMAEAVKDYKSASAQNGEG